MVFDNQQTLLKLMFVFKFLSVEYMPLDINISFPPQSCVKLAFTVVFTVSSLFIMNVYNILSFEKIMLNISSYNILPRAR